jgi:hypothetical protein
MNTLDINWSPLTSALAETPPKDSTELFEILESHCEASNNFKLELSSVLGEGNAISALMAESNVELLINELDARSKLMAGGDFVQLWATFDALKSTYHSSLVLKEISKVDDVLTDAMFSEMKRLKEMSEGVDFNYLASGMKQMVDDLQEDAPGQTSAEFAFNFLATFVYRVMGQVVAPTNFWEIFLLKLESRLLPATLYPEMSPLFTVFRILESNLQNQPALYEFCLLSEETQGAEQVALNIAGLAFAKAAPLQYRRELFMKLDAEFFFELEVTGSFSDKNAPWRSALHNRLERSFAELFIMAADGAIKLRDQLATLVNESKMRDEVAKAIAADLSQGMRGGDLLNRIAENCKRVMTAAACAHLLSANFIEAKELFIPAIIAELGISPRAELWRKHSQLFSGLAQASLEMKSELNWSDISKLITALEPRVAQMQGRPLQWMELPNYSQVIGLSVEQNDEWFKKLVSLASIRMLLDERLYGSRWKQTITQWLVDQLFASSKLMNISVLEEQLISTFNSPTILELEDLTLESEHLISMSKTFTAIISRAAAASSLFRSSHQIASGVADDVLYALPEYAERVGAAGRDSCQQDNQITLLKVSELLLASEEDPAEKLSEWWTSLIGSYLANRPASLFEENLTALYRNIGKNLSPAHTDAVFTPIQAMYNDSLSVSCIEAMASRPMDPIGPLIENRLAKVEQGKGSGLFQSEIAALKAIEVEGVEADRANTLVDLLLKYHHAIWSEGSVDVAAARILPLLNLLKIDAGLSELSGKFLLTLEGNQSEERIDLFQQSAHSFANLVYRSRIADLLNEHSGSIARYYSDSMISFAPDYFEGMEREAAISKCSRDQTLLLRKIALFMKNSTPILAWFDLTRYFLELQSAFVDYPDRIWTLSFRTISKSLAKYLSKAEKLLLIRLIDQGESLAKVWSQTHDVAKALFDPSDYVFSAKGGLDKRCRDLLTAVLVADSMHNSGEFSKQSFLNRFYLSSDLSVIDESSLDEVINLVSERATSYLSAQQARSLSHAKTDIISIASAYKAEKDALVGLAKVDIKSRQLEHLKSALEPLESNSQPVVSIFQRVACLTALKSGPYYNAQSEFRSELSLQLLQYFSVEESNKAINIQEIVESLKPSSDNQSSRILQIQTSFLVSLLPRIEESLALLEKSDEVAGSFLQELRAGEHGSYNLGGEQCKDSTQNGFAYVFGTAAISSLLPTIKAPSLFFGRARENLGAVQPSVAANAQAHTCLKLAELLPSQSIAGFAVACEMIETQGALWNKVAFSSEVVVEKILLSDCAVFASLLKSSDKLEAALLNLLVIYSGELEHSGDWQMAQMTCIGSMQSALADHGVEALTMRLRSLLDVLDKSFGFAKSAFWVLHIGVIVDTLYQVEVGYQISQNAELAAKAYVEKKFVDIKSEDAAKCYRDQLYTLRLVGSSLSTFDSGSAILNPVKFHVNHVVSYLKNSSLELSQNWAFYEKWFIGRVTDVCKPTLHLWFGRFMNSYGRSVRIADFVRDVMPNVSEELAAKFELKIETVDDFLSGLCAASLIDVEAQSAAVVGHAERVLLGSTIPELMSEDRLAQFIETIEPIFESHSSGKVPNLLKRVFIELPEILGRISKACAAEGSNMARFYIANANSPMVPSMWKASNLARTSVESRSVEADRNDALVARVLGVQLPEEGAIVKAVISSKHAKVAMEEAKLSAAQKKKSLFGLISKSGRAEVDWLNDTDMHEAARRVISRLIYFKILGLPMNDYSLFFYSKCDTKKMIYDIAATELYQSISKSLITDLGEEHEIANELNGYIDSLVLNYSADRLIESGEEGNLFFGLVCAKIRSADEGVAYYTDTRPEADFEKLQSKSPALVSHEAETVIKVAVSTLKQSMQLN